MRDDERQQESERALEQVRRDTESVGRSSLSRLGDHFAARDAEGSAEGGGTDPVEVWGRRIGRALSLVGVVVLTWWLGVQLRWW